MVTLDRLNNFFFRIWGALGIDFPDQYGEQRDTFGIEFLQDFIAVNFSKIGREVGTDEGNKGSVQGFNLKSLTQETSYYDALNLGEGIVYHDGVNSNAYFPDSWTLTGSDQYDKVEVGFAADDTTPQVGVIAQGMTGNFFTANPTSVTYSVLQDKIAGKSTDGNMGAYPNRTVFAAAPVNVAANIRYAQNLCTPSLSPRQSSFPDDMAYEISQYEEW